MQGTALKKPLDIHQGPLNSLTAPLRAQKPSPPRFNKKDPSQESMANLTFSSSKEIGVPLLLPQKQSQNATVLLEDDLTKATNCLSLIEDPLWKHVCRDVLNMMGALSLLKIWESTLGEISFQSKNIEIFCTTEEIATFIQQYDFVILGSLRSYLPALKKLRIKTVHG